MRAATCTPVNFPTDDHFFGRDTGLLCRGFQELDVECLVILPGDATLETRSDVIRTTAENLADTAWWRDLKLDLVVLYAWGDPRYQNVATAIREAGIRLVQSLYTAGLTTPYGNFPEWRKCFLGLLTSPFPAATKLKLVMRSVRDFIPAIHEKKRVTMLANCDALAAVSDPASKSVAGYVTALGQPEIAEKLFIVPHCVVPSMVFHASEHRKIRKVLVVGRWTAEDRTQKDPELTVAVLGHFLTQEPAWTAEIVGRDAGALSTLARKFGDAVRARLTLTESIPREQLVSRYQESDILLCASRFESFHISSAEALCCGCSIVATDHPLMASAAWFVTKQSGRLAPNRNLETLVTILRAEAASWQSGTRDAATISENWRAVLHAKNVAQSIIARLGLA